MSETHSASPTLPHRLEYAAFRGVEWLLSGVSIATAARVGRLAGRIFHALSPRYRRLVRRNLRIATAASPPPPAALDELVLETFRRVGANFLAALRTPTVAPATLESMATSDGMELLGGRGPGGRGLIPAMPHMGNWEALTRIAKKFVGPGNTYGGVYRPLDNPLMDELTRRRRCTDGARLFSRKDGFHAPAGMLREGGVLGILADQRAGGHGEAMPFFGKLTTCSPLPELLARRGRADVAILTVITTAPGKWRVVCRPIAEPPTTARIMGALEAGMRESLPDVFWFHDRWRTDAARPLSFFTRIDPEVAATATVPLRLVVTLPAGLAPTIRERFLRRLFELRPDLRLDLVTHGGEDTGDPRVVRHRTAPGPTDLRGIDAAHPAPLDGALLFSSDAGLARAAKRLGLRSIIGLDVSGKPWTRSFPRPADLDGWLRIADDLARVPPRHRR